MADRICYAFSMQGQRCEQESGHDGDHTFTITWSDDDLWQPSVGVEEVLEAHRQVVRPAAPESDADEPVVLAEKCFACGHKWHDDECEAMHEGIPCGCFTAVG